MKSKQIIKTLLKPLPLKSYLAFIIATLAKTTAIVAFPFFIQAILVSITENQSADSQIVHKVFLFFALMLSCEILYLQINKRTYNIFNHHRREFTQKIHQTFLEMDYSIFDDSEKLDDAYAAFEPTYNNTEGIEGVYHTLFDMGWKILSVMIITIYLAIFNVWIAPVFILATLFKLYLSLRTKDLDQKNLDEFYQYKRKLVYFTYDSSDIAYGKEKRIYKFSDNIKRYFNNYLNQYYAFLILLDRKKRKFYILSEIVQIGSLIVVFVIIFLATKQNLMLNYIATIMTVLFLFFELIQNTVFDIAFIRLESAKCQKTLDFISRNQYRFKSLIPITTIDKIEFKNVTFSYPNSQTPAIKNLSFILRKNETVALLGLNGAGKTTLTKLLLGLYLPQSGSILINDINLNDIDKTSFFSLITYLEQEQNLFSISLIDFLCAKTKHKDYDRAKFCLESVGLYQKISQSRHGLDSLLTKDLDEAGLEFSGGELQKLYIARTLYNQACDCYIFDEPTASLDNQSEKTTFETLNNICQGKIALYISHKLKTTGFCQKIMILNQGELVEEGTKSELIQLQGQYYQLLMADLESEGKYETQNA